MHELVHRRFHIESYGCTYNHADTQKLITIATRQGCVQVLPDEAEVIIINSCTVVAATERTMLRRLRAFQDKEVIITGCMPVVQKELILEMFPRTRILMPDEIYASHPWKGVMLSPAVGVMQVGPGCMGACTYCITRAARGRMKSIPVKTIVTEIERLARAGAAEVQLTGQDLSAYGMDCGTDLAVLLEAIGECVADVRVRVGMMNPATVLPILDRLVDAFRSEKIFSFAHLPVQAGSDSVLQDMNRGYSAAEYCMIVDAFRRAIPDIRISTDFIVGFPTETDADFEATLSLLRTACPTKVNITRFSVREGTPAAKFRDLPDRVKKDRSRALTVAAAAISDRHNEALIGKEFDVVVTEQKKTGSVIARSPGYENIVIQQELPLGFRCRVMITRHHRHYLIGRPL
ncbi:MAG TPA: tRNA (N(6)-L-threonylcarbamoyladenosine(37)-C(2))-methylthiotransferase [Methanoculleus sp.]|nr:tRNA (N(6)-L-threonylcarbamoyladenosine(37)-C(2))-methylthiotransferase [Methanoculleus sp.]